MCFAPLPSQSCVQSINLLFKPSGAVCLNVSTFVVEWHAVTCMRSDWLTFVLTICLAINVTTFLFNLLYIYNFNDFFIQSAKVYIEDMYCVGKLCYIGFYSISILGESKVC